MNSFTIFRRIAFIVRPFWARLVALAGLSLLATPIALLTPVPVKIVVDSALDDQPLPGVLASFVPNTADPARAALVIAVVMLIGVAVVQQLQSLGRTLLSTFVSESIVVRFRTDLFRHLQRLSLSYHDTMGTADSLYRVQYDATAAQYIAVEGIIPVLTSAITLVAMLGVAWSLSPSLAGIALVVAPVLLLVFGRYRPRLRQESRRVKRLDSSAMSVVQEVLGAVRVVKAFGQEGREHARFVNRSDEGVWARIGLAHVEATMGLWVGVTIAAGMAAVLWVGVDQVQAGELSLGNLLLVVGYLGQFYAPMKTMSSKVGRLQSHLVSAERAFTLLDQATDVAERRNALPIDRAAGRIEFRNVGFSYDGEIRVMQNVDLDVAPGSRVGIVGATGAGKTTLANLMMRFYDVTEGAILLDGTDIRDYRLADLRNQFSIVLQEPVLFSTTIRENIAYARPDATDEEIQTAAQAANVHAFIVSLPDGYDTLVGERGMRLSGGERQRISLARAFLKDAPILILDEPTSAVDVRTEAGIMKSIERLMRGRTTFMIAHRLTTLENCNSVIEVEAGTVKNRLMLGASNRPFRVAAPSSGTPNGA